MRGFLILSVLCGASAARAAESRPVILEAAPLRGVMGHPAVRAETAFGAALAVGFAYEASDAPSERADFKDHRRAYAVEGLWYPTGLKLNGAFVGGGVSYEEADVGRQRPRDSRTWARTTSDESHDLWVNHDTYLSLSETVGYRLVETAPVTASIRLVRDETLQQSSRIERDEVYSGDPDLSSAGREPVATRIVLYAGLLLR